MRRQWKFLYMRAARCDSVIRDGVIVLQSVWLLQLLLFLAEVVCCWCWALDKEPRSLTVATFCATIRLDESGRRCVWLCAIGVEWPDIVSSWCLGQDKTYLGYPSVQAIYLGWRCSAPHLQTSARPTPRNKICLTVSFCTRAWVRRSDEWMANRREHRDRCSNGYNGGWGARHDRERQQIHSLRQRVAH